MDYCLSTLKTARVSDQFIFMRWNKKRYIMCYFTLTYDDNLILDIFDIKMSGIIVF